MKALARAWKAFGALCFVPTALLAQTEPPHPILSISGSGSGASTILSTYSESQYTNSFVPHQSPRNDSYGFAPAVVSGDTGWSWSTANPNQITSTPSGTVFPTTTLYPIQTQAVTVFSGNTVNVPYYFKAGSTSSKSLVFALIDYHKVSQLRSDFGKLSPAYVNSGSSPGSRNDAYARRIAVALLDWAYHFPDFYMTGKNSASFINVTPSYILGSDLQRASDHNGLAHEWSSTDIQALDAIYDSVALTNLSAEVGFDVRNYIKTNLFCNEGDFIVYHVPVDVAIQSNLSDPYTILALVARVLNRPDYIIWMDQYLDATVRQKIRRDGVLEEGIGYSIGYINQNLNGAQNTHDYFLTRAATNATLLAISNRAGSYISTLKYGQSQWAAAALPNGELPAFGDTPFGGYFSARNTGNSTLLPAYGHVSMGAGLGSQSLQVNQNFPGNNNHMRSDTTAFVLWAFNNEYLGDIRYYNGTPGRQFDEQILSHNAVTIDRVNETPYPDADTYGNGDLTLYEAGNNGLALTEIDGQRAYSGKASRYQRLLLLNTVDLTRPYLVDVFRVTGGTNHDYTLHGSIRWDQTWQCSFPLVTNPSPYPMLEGETWVEPTSSGSSFPYYGFWRNVSSNQAPGNFQITYRDTNRLSGRDVRLWMTDDGTAKVYLGITPNPGRDNTVPANFYVYWRPSAIIRKRITSGTLQDLFVSVVEPMNGGSGTIASVDRLPVNGSSLEAAALRITFTDGRTDTYLVNLHNPQVAGASGGSTTISTADGQYTLAGRVGVHADRANGDSRVWTMNATDFQYPGRRFTTPNTYYAGLISGETRKFDGASNDAFVTSSPLPPGVALRNAQLSLTHGTLSGSGTTGISEMFKVDQVILSNSQYYVCFTNDHMLEITNGTTSVEQMAPLRTFTGSNSFEIALSAFAGQISAIPDVNIPVNGSSGPLAFTFGNLGATAGASLQVTASSSNPPFVPNANLVLGGSGTSRAITVTPAPGASGTSVITISVTDGVWTNSRSFNAISADFLLTASPPAQSVLIGGATNFIATVAATNGFSGTVTFGIGGLPTGATAAYAPPSIIGVGSSTLTVTTTTTTPPGSYPLNLSAVSGSLSSTSTVILTVASVAASAGTMLWNPGTAPAGTNWSPPLNWTNLTAGGYGPPGVSNDVVFSDAGSAGSSNLITSVVDASLTIDSLLFTNISGYQTVLIAPGNTLTVNGSVPGYQNTPTLSVGLDTSAAAPYLVRAAMTGPAGALVLNNTAATLQVREGANAATDGSLASLDLSGLGTLTANLNHLQLGVESGAPRCVAGVLALAKTNTITLVQPMNANATNYTGGNPALYLGHNTHSGNTNGSVLYLGTSNRIFVNYAVIGRGNQTNNLLAFHPASLSDNPTALFRASDGVGRVGLWTIGDNSSGSLTGPSSATNDFTGGSIDALVDKLFVGRGRVGTTANTGVGVLTLAAGTMDVNTLRLGTMVDESTSTNASGVGIANINGTATLIVNSLLELAHTNTTAAATAAAVAGTTGTLNVNGGTVQATNIVGTGGKANINLNSGVIDLQPAWAVSPGAISNISTLNLGAPGVAGLALLTNAAVISTTNTLTIASNGLLAGNTLVVSPRLVLNGAISPGTGATGGITNTGPVTLGPGGQYLWNIQDALGAPGSAWDYLQAGGALDVQATSANPFVLQLQTIEDTLNGLPDFDNTTPWSWTIATGAGAVANFAPAKFMINDGLFADDLAGGYFTLSASGASLVLSFTNNHPPIAADAASYYAPGTVLRLPLSDLSSQWSDPDGDPVALLNVAPSSANGLNNVSFDGTYIYYTNALSIADTITYTITDLRTNPPAIYRPGDTVQTAVGLIQILPPPAIGSVTLAGGQVVMSGSNGVPGGSYYVLSSTNVSLPLSLWTRLATNSFDPAGVFMFTNSAANLPQQYFLLQLPK